MNDLDIKFILEILVDTLLDHRDISLSRQFQNLKKAKEILNKVKEGE